MKVILLFFLFIIVFIIGVIFSKVKIQLYTIQNLSDNGIGKSDFRVIISIYLFYKIKIFKKRFDNKKHKKILKRQFKFDKDIFKILKNSRLQLEQLDLNINLDTQSIPLTTFLIVLISTIIESILTLNINSINSKQCKYMIKPLYQNTNLINLKLDSIITGDFVHITNIVYKLIKKVRGINNERTSNRRSYGYSNE